MRVVFIAPFAIHPKSTTRWRVLPLARALAAAGHAVRVVIPPYDWPQHAGLAWHDQGVQVINVVLRGGQGPAGHALLAGRLAQVALAWQPDVVHCFKPKGPGGLAARALLAGRVPVVVDADDYEAAWNGVAGYPILWARLFAWQERTLLRRADAVTAASRWLEQFAAGLGQNRRFYLPNGIEYSHSEDTINCSPGPPAANRPSKGRVVLYTRFVEHGAQEVWQIWRRVLEAEPGARLLVAGRGRNGEEVELAALAAAASSVHAVQLLGWLPASARPGLFAAVDVALLPVRDTPLNRAKSPMRLLDLLAAGVPVVTQQVGEYGDLVRHGATGLVTAPGDAAGLAHSVLTLLRDPGLSQRLGQAAWSDMRARRAWPVLVQTALAAYGAAGCELARPGV